MPGAGLTVVVGDDEVLFWLSRMQGASTRFEPIMHVIAESFVGRVNEEFDSAGHGRWPPLARSTLMNRRPVGAAGRRLKRGSRAGSVSIEILKDTGRLGASIEPFWGKDYAEAGTSVRYAVYHVSEDPRTVIPLRNFFDIPAESFDEAADMLLSGILGESPRRR